MKDEERAIPEDCCQCGIFFCLFCSETGNCFSSFFMRLNTHKTVIHSLFRTYTGKVGLSSTQKITLEIHQLAYSVSLGLLCDSRTQDWGTTKFYFKRIKGTRKGRKNRKKIDICVF
jgi:hypothetical protein